MSVVAEIGTPAWQATPVSSAVTRQRPSPWRAPFQWWRSLSETERVDLYTRGSLYALSASEPLVILGVVTGQDEQRTVPGIAALLLSLAHTAACLLLCRAGMDAYLRRRDFPRVEIAVAVALGAALAVTTVGFAPGPAGALGAEVVVVLVALAYTGAAVATVVPLRQLTYAGPLAVGLVVAVALARGAEVEIAFQLAFTSAALLFAVSTYRFSVWLLGVIAQLEDAQQSRAALAVAEERLRFSRDLHDVVGRHLSAIAVKSELTAQLAQRSDERAVPEALEVRGLAHDLLREVREVVRGYREVDLDAELAGSRALLRSAGVRCRTVGDAAGWPPPVQAALGWGVREATTNVLRHSAAGTCTITLRSTPDRAELSVTNDGVAAGAESAVRGSGLAGLAERVRPLGGTVEAGPEPPDRFVLRVVVPLGRSLAQP